MNVLSCACEGMTSLDKGEPTDSIFEYLKTI